MWRVRHLLVLAAVLGVGLVLSACGGDSSPETPIVVPTETTQGSLSKAEFIAQADSACAEANSSIEQFAASGQGESEAAQIAQLRQGVIDQIKQLNPPSDPTLDQFLKAMSDEVSAGQKIGLAVQRGEDPSQFETELDSAKSDAESAASAYGFKECGKAISSSSTSTSGSGASSSSSSGGAVTPSAPSTGAPSAGAPSGGAPSGGTGGGTPGSSGTSGSSGNSGSSGSGGSGGIGPG
jgi:hypothetical protein